VSTVMRPDSRGHKEALTFEELQAKVVDLQARKVDYVVDTRRVGFFDEGSDFAISIDGVNDVSFKVGDRAHKQIAGRLKIPRIYYDRMRKDAPQLLQRNVEHWFINQPEKRMIRAYNGEEPVVRAFLSDRYRRLDNFDLLQHLGPELGKIDGLEYHVGSLTPEKLFLRVTLPGLEAPIRVGDMVRAGVEISNSEVGSGALQVRPYILRLVCMNGMVSNVALRRYHTGARVEETEDELGIYSDETLKADDKALFMKAADLVRASLTEASFATIVDRLRDLTATDEIQAPVAAVQVLGDRLDLTEGERERVLTQLVKGADLSQWGAINALTETAKDAESFDRLVELEEAAGRLTELDAQEWARVAVAA